MTTRTRTRKKKARASGPRGGDLVQPWRQAHAPDTRCPSCGTDMTRVALTKTVYTFERCECAEAPYPHLIERLWHRDHFCQSLSTKKSGTQ